MRKPAKQSVLFFLQIALLTVLCGCQSAYYATMEAMGHPKREILVDRVEDARDSQTEAKEQFVSALEKFGEVVQYTGGQLEEKYKQLNSEYEKSEKKAKAVSKRIVDVENVAEALFAEWQEELNQYSSDQLRQASQKKLQQTILKYNKLMSAMKKARDKISPVLSAFKDQVLYLKHNLNAQAIASLQDELDSVETDIAALVKEMEASIAEADAFINSMTGQM